MRINATRWQLPSGSFVPEVKPKNLLVWHMTAGWAAEHAVQTWLANRGRAPVATAFVLDLDGQVYQVFDPRCWAYHLGVARLIGNSADERSIGVEVVNLGPLTRRGDDLLAYGRRVCGMADTGQYIEMSAPFRGSLFFHRPTVAQQQAMRDLQAFLVREHGIPNVFPPANRRDVTDVGFFRSFTGICSHVNFSTVRSDWPAQLLYPILGVNTNA